MTSLPYDVLYEVVARASASCYYTLCVTSRDFNAMTTPLLHRNISLDFEKEIQTEQFLDTIINNSKLAQHVASLLLSVSSDLAIKVPQALRQMTHLRHLDFATLNDTLKYHSVDFVEALRELKKLDSVHLSGLETDVMHSDVMNSILDALPPLKKIYINTRSAPLPGLGRLLLRSINTLEYFAADAYELDVFTESHRQGLVWPRMQKLEAVHFRSLSIAQAIPGLKQLVLRELPERESVLWDESYFPSLDTLFLVIKTSLSTRPTSQRSKLAHLQLRVLTFGGPIDASCTTNFTNVMACFDWRSLRSLSIETWTVATYKAVTNSLPSIFDHCSSLCLLRLESIDSDPTINIKLETAMAKLLTWIPKLPQLKFVHVTRRDMWRCHYEEGFFDDVSKSVPEAFTMHANLRVVEVEMKKHPASGVEYWQWTRRRTAAASSTTDEPVIFRTVFRYTGDSDPLPREASAIAELVDNAE